MIVELFQYLRNPGSVYARKLGYSKELIAIEARYNRHKGHWQSHLENSQQVILKASEACTEKNTVMILGAGLLYDIPLDYLSNTFKQVYLVDIVFSSLAKNMARKFRNIKLVTHDLNGIQSQLLKLKRGESPAPPQPDLPSVKQKPDLVISANLLSQLHLAPTYFLEKKHFLSEEIIFDYAKSIIQAHVNLLKNCTANVCLITDYYRIHREDSRPMHAEHALLGVELPKPERSWHWLIAPRGEIARDQSMETEVYAYYNFK